MLVRILKEMVAIGITLMSVSGFRERRNTHNQSFLLCRAGLSQGEDTASNRHLSPQAEFRFSAAEGASRVHDEDPIRRQPVDLSALLPLRRFLL
jgi:hypothetical protein